MQAVGRSGPDFAGGSSGANIEDRLSLIIHWSSGSHKRSTNWAIINTAFILVGALTGGWPGAMAPLEPLNAALGRVCRGLYTWTLRQLSVFKSVTVDDG